MADIKPIYKKIDGKWVKQNAYEKQNNQWIKISTTDTEENMVSYIGYSNTEDVCDSLFTEPTMQVVNSNNLVGTYTLTTTSPGYIYWLTPTPINSIMMDGFPVSYSTMADATNGVYDYNGDTLYCYSSDARFKVGTYTFIIT